MTESHSTVNRQCKMAASSSDTWDTTYATIDERF